jgi:replicative DNA helicase
MDERELILRLVGQMTGIRTSSLRRGVLSGEDWRRVYDLRARARELGTIHVDQQSSIDCASIAARVRQLQAKQPLSAVFVDYLTLMAGGNPRESGHQRVQENARGLAALAKEANVKMVVAAQLSRDNAKGNRRPRLADLREAGEEPAWGVIMLHRDESAEGDHLSLEGEMIVAKNRTGCTGVAPVRFDGATQRFINPIP